MTTFQRNAIIAGYINSYCLVCECFFETEEQTFSHIRDEEHGTRLLLYPYLEKYGSNCIRKVKAGYFCEHCSLLMTTAAKVNLHIAEKTHYYNKGNGLLKQSGSVLTAFDDVLIPESAWHSFADDACAVCDAEFDDPDEHKIERAHILKLLQNKVEFAHDNNIYRKIDKNNFQCLTCNCVPPLSTLDDHFNEDSHKQKYFQCQEEKRKYDLANPKQVQTKEIKEKEMLGEKGAKVNQNLTINIDNVTGTPVTNEAIKKAEKIQPETLKSPPKPQSETKKSTDSKIQNKNDSKPIQKQEPSDPAYFAKENKLTYDPRNSNAFCKTCEQKFSSTLRGMKEHVSGRDHINKKVKAASKPPPKKNNLKKQTMEEFVKQVSTFNNTLDNDTVINETICIPEKSCHMFTKVGCMFAECKCQICLMNLSEDDFEEHCQTAKHEKGMRQTSIILDLKNEFIREVRPETFHCGYCNLMIAGWTATEEHLKTAEHKASTATCNRRLQIHLPAIRAHKDEDKIKAAFFEMVVNHMRR